LHNKEIYPVCFFVILIRADNDAVNVTALLTVFKPDKAPNLLCDWTWLVFTYRSNQSHSIARRAGCFISLNTSNDTVMSKTRECNLKIQFNGELDNNECQTMMNALFMFLKSNLKICFKVDPALRNGDRNIAIKLDLVRQDLAILHWRETAWNLCEILVEKSLVHKQSVRSQYDGTPI